MKSEIHHYGDDADGYDEEYTNGDGHDEHRDDSDEDDLDGDADDLLDDDLMDKISSSPSIDDGA